MDQKKVQRCGIEVTAAACNASYAIITKQRKYKQSLEWTYLHTPSLDASDLWTVPKNESAHLADSIWSRYMPELCVYVSFSTIAETLLLGGLETSG